uniref:NHR domain-containing protein n=1 Tax=Macrostomum lignano TaxID=282301 RepID=A0A1I8FK63_9PLAT
PPPPRAGVHAEPGPLMRTLPDGVAGQSATGLGFTIVGARRARPAGIPPSQRHRGPGALRRIGMAGWPPGDVLMFVNDTLVLGFHPRGRCGTVQLLGARPRRCPDCQPRPTACPAVPMTPQLRSSPSLAVGPAGYGGSIQDVQSAAIRFYQLGQQLAGQLVLPRTNTGFGFTIADSAQGQRVRLIVEPDRCRGLRWRSMPAESRSCRMPTLSAILSDCPVGSDATFLLQRGCPTLTSADLAILLRILLVCRRCGRYRCFSSPPPLPPLVRLRRQCQPVLTGKGQESGGLPRLLLSLAASTTSPQLNSALVVQRRQRVRPPRHPSILSAEASTIVQHQQHVVAFPTSQRPARQPTVTMATSNNGNSRDVTVARAPDEGFGFVIVSAVTRQPDGTSDIGEFVAKLFKARRPPAACAKGDRNLGSERHRRVPACHHEDIVPIVREA